jgi:hypothetical protein
MAQALSSKKGAPLMRKGALGDRQQPRHRVTLAIVEATGRPQGAEERVSHKVRDITGVRATVKRVGKDEGLVATVEAPERVGIACCGCR